MQYEYDEYDEYGQDAEYENYNNWEVRLEGEVLGVFETKEESILFIFDELEQLTEDFYGKLKILGYSEDELLKILLDFCAIDFYEEFDNLLLKLKIEEEFKLINLDNDEPEFGEL